MRQFAIHGFAAVAIICALLFAAGCSGPSGKPAVDADLGQPVELALKFAPADSTTYKVVLESGRSVQWEGASPKPGKFQGGRTSNRMEMTFSQQIESVGDQGNAVAKITIKGLKYVVMIKDKVALDFDSSREADRDKPLNSLIGQSYTIEMTPSGQVSKIIDNSDALAAVSSDKTASVLISADAIKQRHTISGLPAAGENQLRTGQEWSNVKSVSFDMMGTKSFERIYTLKEIEQLPGRRVAVVEMEAFPSAAKAKELHKEQSAGLFSQMSDNTQEYGGRLKLDLTEGKVTEYSERMGVEWLFVDPDPENGKPPAALRIGATRLFSIERAE